MESLSIAQAIVSVLIVAEEIVLTDLYFSKKYPEKQFHTLSVRNTNNVSLFMKNDFISTFEKMGNEFKQQKRPRNVMIQQTDQSIFENQIKMIKSKYLVVKGYKQIH